MIRYLNKKEVIISEIKIIENLEGYYMRTNKKIFNICVVYLIYIKSLKAIYFNPQFK